MTGVLRMPPLPPPVRRGFGGSNRSIDDRATPSFREVVVGIVRFSGKGGVKLSSVLCAAGSCKPCLGIRN